MIVPTDSPSIFTSIDDLTTLQKNAIIRPNNPPPGLAGFVFDIITEDGAELSSNITDHYVEDNSAVQDHIALAPEIITVRGLVGELAMTKAQVDAVAKEIDALPIVTELSPKYDPIATNRMIDQQRETELSVNSKMVQKTLEKFYDARAVTGNSKQARAFGYFYQLWKSRERFTVDTPWGFFTNMAIQNLRATQGEDTKYISDFVITFKKIRVAKAVEFKPGQIAGRAEPQTKPVLKNAALGTEEVNQSAAKGLLTLAVGTP
jgi:hypothetical protein